MLDPGQRIPKPGELLDSAEGAREVKILLNRIAHGIAV
ncbi:DUF2384 domain-containing protein [Microvirga brassicacearum]|uniref:DUF2384 domain-containing protein n=1 Tax=Microvirga brassicacearum TaxID=2580413 RepID=A0A5N3PDL6_9HYPH|nr:DUF2384 domain-containing protein [Microvirga brassicacearum]